MIPLWRLLILAAASTVRYSIPFYLLLLILCNQPTDKIPPLQRRLAQDDNCVLKFLREKDVCVNVARCDVDCERPAEGTGKMEG